MKPCNLRTGFAVFAAVVVTAIANHNCFADQKKATGIDTTQVPKWSADDLKFFLHGSMSTEVVPEAVLRAFIKIYPDLFPSQDLSHLGMIPDPDFGWPIGLSRKEVKHLGGLPALGLNCASCHVAEVRSTKDAAPVRILGATSHFDAEGFFGGVIVATFRTADPANMKRFASAYMASVDPDVDESTQNLLAEEWDKQKEKIDATMKADPGGSKGVEPGALHDIGADSLQLDDESLEHEKNLAAFSHSILKLFHNMRAALHVPDQPPEKAPPSSGPGRNDAFGLLSAGLFNAPQPYAPVKYGLVWNVGKRHWVHWDGNTQSPLGRNLLASLGLGAPLHGKHGDLDFAMVKRQTDLTEMIQPPHYPYKIDEAAAKRGAAHYTAKCVSCHGGTESDKRLYSVTGSRHGSVARGAFHEGAGRFVQQVPRRAGNRRLSPAERGRAAQHGKILGGEHGWSLGAISLSAQRLGSDHARVTHSAGAARQNISPWLPGLRRHSDGLRRCRGLPLRYLGSRQFQCRP